MHVDVENTTTYRFHCYYFTDVGHLSVNLIGGYHHTHNKYQSSLEDVKVMGPLYMKQCMLLDFTTNKVALIETTTLKYSGKISELVSIVRTILSCVTAYQSVSSFVNVTDFKTS